jgi:hypothetical protein
MMSIAQAGLTVNFTYMLNETAKQIAYIVSRALGEDIASLEVSEQAETEWVDTVIRLAASKIGSNDACTPGYYNNEGTASEAARQNSFYFGEPTEFVTILERWRAEGAMKGLELG